MWAMPSMSRWISVTDRSCLTPGARGPAHRRVGSDGGGWHTWVMPMRQDCKYFESRTYPNGDTVRKCDLDLAPQAPWRCPDDCPKYTRRLVDVNWKHGTLITPETPDEPAGLDDDDGSIAALLDAAEDIVNAAGPGMLADVEAERERQAMPRWKRLIKRKKGTKRDGKDDA